MIIAIIQIILSALIITLILLQERSSGMSGLLGGDGGGYYQARRGMEKLVFYRHDRARGGIRGAGHLPAVRTDALASITFLYMWFKKIFAALTKKERIVFVLALAGTVVSFVVVMGIVIAQTTKAVPAAGGEYVEGMLGQPEYINPVIASSQTDLDLVKMIYSNIPDLADSITASPDLKTWDVRLKQGLTWQDGQQLTSDDVVFTVQSIQNPDAQFAALPKLAGRDGQPRERTRGAVHALESVRVLWRHARQFIYSAETSFCRHAARQLASLGLQP